MEWFYPIANDDDQNDLLNTMIRDNASTGASSTSRGMDGNSVSSIDSDDIDFLKDADQEKDVFRTKVGT